MKEEYKEKQNTSEVESSQETEQKKDDSNVYVKLNMMEIFVKYQESINTDNYRDGYYEFWNKIGKLGLKELPEMIRIVLNENASDSSVLALKMLKHNQILKDDTTSLRKIFFKIYDIDGNQTMHRLNMNEQLSVLKKDKIFIEQFLDGYANDLELKTLEYYIREGFLEGLQGDIQLQEKAFLKCYRLDKYSQFDYFDLFPELKNNLDFQLRFLDSELVKDGVNGFLEHMVNFEFISGNIEVQKKIWDRCFELNSYHAMNDVEKFNFYENDNKLSREILFKGITAEDNLLLGSMEHYVNQMSIKDDDLDLSSKVEQSIIQTDYLSMEFGQLEKQIAEAESENNIEKKEQLIEKYERRKDEVMKAFDEALIRGRWDEAMTMTKVNAVRDRFSKYGKKEITDLMEKRKSEQFDFLKRNYWKSQFVKDGFIDDATVESEKEEEKRLLKILEKIVGIKNIKPSNLLRKSFEVFHQSENELQELFIKDELNLKKKLYVELSNHFPEDKLSDFESETLSIASKEELKKKIDELMSQCKSKSKGEARSLLLEYEKNLRGENYIIKDKLKKKLYVELLNHFPEDKLSDFESETLSIASKEELKKKIDELMSQCKSKSKEEARSLLVEYEKVLRGENYVVNEDDQKSKEKVSDMDRRKYYERIISTMNMDFQSAVKELGLPFSKDDDEYAMFKEHYDSIIKRYKNVNDRSNENFIMSILKSGQTISENSLKILNDLFDEKNKVKLEDFIKDLVQNSKDLDDKVLNELLEAKESNKIPERMKTIIQEFINRGFRGLSDKTLAKMYSLKTDVEREDLFEEWEKIVKMINSGQRIPEEIKKHEFYTELVYTAYQPEEMTVEEVRTILKDTKSQQEHFKKWEYPGKNSDPSIIKLGSLTSPEDKEKEILDLIEKSESEEEIKKLELNLKSIAEKKKKWKKLFPKIQNSVRESFDLFLKMSEIGLENLDDSRFKKIITNAAVKSGKFEKPENKEYLMRYYFSRPENKDLIKKIKKLKKDFENDSSNLEDLYHYISEIELIYRDMENGIREPVKEKVLETQEKICEKLRESIKDTFIQFEGNIGLQISDGARSEKMISYIVKRGGKFEEQEFKDMVMRYYFSRPEKKGVYEKLMKLKEEFEKDSLNLEDLYHYVFEIELIYKDMELMAEELVNKKRKNLLKKSKDKVHIGREKFMEESKRWKDPDFLFQEKLEKSLKKYGEKYGDENGALSESLISILAKKSVNKEFQDDSQQMFKHRKNMRNLLDGRNYRELQIIFSKEVEAYLSRAMAGLCTKRDTHTFEDELMLQANILDPMTQELVGNIQYNFSKPMTYLYERPKNERLKKVEFGEAFQIMLARVNPKDTILSDNEEDFSKELMRIAWDFVDANQHKNKIQLYLPEQTHWHALTTRTNDVFVKFLQRYQNEDRYVLMDNSIALSGTHNVGGVNDNSNIHKLLDLVRRGVSDDDYKFAEDSVSKDDKIYPCMRDPKP